MRTSRPSVLWVLALVAILTSFVFTAPPTASATEVNESVDKITAETEPAALAEAEAVAVDAENDDTVDPSESDPQEEPSVKLGLSTENGKICFYNEDGTLFTEGYKEVTVDGVTKYYFFQEDGTAFTDGYKAFSKNGTRVYYYFQEDGSAFTGGYKEIVIDGKLHYFYFLSNGQGFNTGYKTAMIDGKKYYFYFGSDGRAVTNSLQTIPLGERTAYMLFNEDGKAYTQGYKEIVNEEDTDYYYFLTNGQAFTTGYKTVKIDDVTYYFYFEENGKAFTDGLKAVPFGTLSYYYFFRDNGRARTSGWEKVGTQSYYFQANGRAAKDAFVTIGSSRYYFDNHFNIKTGGWFCVGNGYYYADHNGVLSTNTVIEGYALDANGKSSTKYRIIQYVNQHTNPSMTDQEKIKALYDWVLYNDMEYLRSYEHVAADWVWKDSWVDDMAASQMDNWGGNCYRYAAFLGMLIQEATGLPVTVYHGIQVYYGTIYYHGWITVEQDGIDYAYDVELDKHADWSTASCYKVPYSITSQDMHTEGVGTNLY